MTCRFVSIQNRDKLTCRSGIKIPYIFPTFSRRCRFEVDNGGVFVGIACNDHEVNQDNTLAVYSDTIDVSTGIFFFLDWPCGCCVAGA